MMVHAEGYLTDPSIVGRVRQALAHFDGQPVTVKVNSKGGRCYLGLALHYLLRETPNVTTLCDGEASSAAVALFLGGQRRLIEENSIIRMHLSRTPRRQKLGDPVAEALRQAMAENARQMVREPSAGVFVCAAGIASGLLGAMLGQKESGP